MFGLGAIGLIIYVFTIFDVVSGKFTNPNDKLIWVVIVVLVPLVGAILWFLIGRGKRI
ncbi:PLDc N-terminal domain-containing protein [Algoriphagus antarcticus]|uniref:Phospholipase D-like protein n=1 Tax=Algoriphagus antarcticus TaxID=238540 RepID=A0A3E0DQ28_9BACT|nr:PLDc N-terminal domain-containing protein [Algoriphagus antarcticus]REG83611.1 phospholipase D-like protein [Algoriphagus antarcticus]